MTNVNMTRDLADKIATCLIEGGVRTRTIVATTMEHTGASEQQVRAVRKVLEKYNTSGMDKAARTAHHCTMADAIHNKWEDAALGITN